MFVDDEEAIIAVNQKAFFSLGYEVTTTLNGMDALQLLAQDPDKYDLVMTDMSMPKMNGAELTKRILQIRPDMPIIICTGYSELINEDRAAKIGAKAYVMKPVVLTDMAKTIRRVLDGKS
jgi:CheY-like chemotaxis protein